MGTTWVHHKPTGLREPVGENRLKTIQEQDPAGEEWEILGPLPVPLEEATWTISETSDGFVTTPLPLGSPYKSDKTAEQAIRKLYPEASIAFAGAEPGPGATGAEEGASGPEAQTTGGEPTGAATPAED